VLVVTSAVAVVAGPSAFGPAVASSGAGSAATMAGQPAEVSHIRLHEAIR
jgi:hypothetical protein